MIWFVLETFVKAKSVLLLVSLSWFDHDSISGSGNDAYGSCLASIFDPNLRISVTSAVNPH